MMKLIGVNVSEPVPLLDDRSGRTVLSGIGKRRLNVETVRVGVTNIAGDGQGDRVAHGGVDKAVYVYPHDHLPVWMAQINYGKGCDAPFGENLSVIGFTEESVHIGDQWLWGDVVLEISQPRWPCYKLGLHSGHRNLPALLIESERSGWYARVVQTGEAPSTGELTRIHSEPDAPSVREAFRAARGLASPEEASRLTANLVLAQQWRHMLEQRYTLTEHPG
jgi:MOSC domain-containing protein YiiM